MTYVKLGRLKALFLVFGEFGYAKSAGSNILPYWVGSVVLDLDFGID